VLQDTNLALETWLFALFLLHTSRRGLSARQLQAQLGITYKSAWRIIDLACYALGRSKPPPLRTGENAPVSFATVSFPVLVRQCLLTPPKRNHPDAIARAAARLAARLRD